MKKKIYKVAIIGLGKAGLLYNINKDKFLSHAKIINENKRLQLIAGVDVDKNKTKLFEKKFNVEAYSNIKELIKKKNLM